MSFILFKLFKSNNKVFYDLFEQSSIQLKVISNLLNLLVNENDFNQRLKIGQDLVLAGKQSELIAHHIFVQLSKNYVTPFDREDIYGLAKSIENIGDYMVITGKKINLYKLASKDVSLEIMVQSVVLAVEAVSNGVLELRNFKKGKLIIESIIKINEISEVSINNFYQCLDSLFEEEENIKEIIKRREIYQILETITEKCKQSGVFLESIVIKYS
jgi:uncharacterized protein Yka (UPF0111/DUF47 family)